MSRYMNADEMLEYLDLMYDKQDDWREPYNTGVLGAINYIKHRASTIDLVRCAECKACKRKRTTFKGEPIFFYRCKEHSRDVESDDYCSWGERRDK